MSIKPNIENVIYFSCLLCEALEDFERAQGKQIYSLAYHQVSRFKDKLIESLQKNID